MTARAETDFPDPDSPTMPSVSPGVIDQLTPSTALTIPASVWNSTWRSSTETSGSAGPITWASHRSLGSRASRSPSPTNTKPSTVKTTARLGQSHR